MPNLYFSRDPEFKPHMTKGELSVSQVEHASWRWPEMQGVSEVAYIIHDNYHLFPITLFHVKKMSSVPTRPLLWCREPLTTIRTPGSGRNVVGIMSPPFLSEYRNNIGANVDTDGLWSWFCQHYNVFLDWVQQTLQVWPCLKWEWWWWFGWWCWSCSSRWYWWCLWCNRH